MIRVLTINIHKGYNWLNRKFILAELREALRSTEADVVFLQEVIGENERKAEKHENWPEDPHYVFLADDTWPAYAYDKSAVYPAGHHGNALLTKFSISHSEKINLSTNRLEKRGFLYCRLTLPDRPFPLHCLSTHLSLFGRCREKQFRRLNDFIQNRIPAHEPLLIGGDFNDWPNKAPAFFSGVSGLKEVFEQARGKPARSFPRSFPLLRLDRIYARGFEVLQTEIYHKDVWAKLSDHAALFACVKFNGVKGGSHAAG